MPNTKLYYLRFPTRRTLLPGAAAPPLNKQTFSRLHFPADWWFRLDLPERGTDAQFRLTKAGGRGEGKGGGTGRGVG